MAVSMKITGLRETLRAFRDLPKDATRELKDANIGISSDLAGKIADAARASSKQSALVAPTVRARRDRLPVVVAGGNKRVGRNRVPAYKVLFGANFGASRLKQFRSHRGAGEDDYWFFKTAEDNQPRIEAEWLKAADRVLDQWGRA